MKKKALTVLLWNEKVIWNIETVKKRKNISEDDTAYNEAVAIKT